MTLPALIDLQTERARIAALEAQRELRDAQTATRRADALHAAARAVFAAVLRDLDPLAGRLVDAIDGEPDETRLHWRLSDLLHDALQEIGAHAEQAARAMPEFGERFRRGAQPRDLLTVSQWADRRRWIVSGTNLPGQWRTDRVPHLRDIMDDLSEHSPVEEVVLMKASGIGGTEALYNWIGYIMDHLGNRDLMVVLGSLELRDRSFNPRLQKMLAETPCLGEIVTRASRASSNRQDLIEYGANARIIKAGANSAESLRSDHIPYVILDEVDAFPWDVGGEGDPLTLIANRQRNFTRAKRLLVSTPVKDQESRIHQEYLAGDRRRRHVPCPHCGDFFILERDLLRRRLRLPREGEPAKARKVVESAWFVCPNCGGEIEEGHKPQMLPAGRWIAEQPHIRKKHSYQISAAYTMIGLGLSWQQLAQRLVDAEEDASKMKAVINTDWGEIWKEEGQGADPVSLLSRREEWEPEQIRANIRPLRVVAGVDVQKDRLEATLAAFGVDEQCWVFEHAILPGDTAQPDVWGDLAEQLREWDVERACIDAGYNTGMVQTFCAHRSWAIPTKGIPGSGRDVIEDDRRRRQRLRTKRRRGRPVEPIGVDQAKALIYSRLNLQKPGPGYVHFPAASWADDEYFAQLAAEQLRTRLRAGRPIVEWVQIRPRNEALDCLILALAAHRLCSGKLYAARASGRPDQDTAPAAGEAAAGRTDGAPEASHTPTPAAAAVPAAETPDLATLLAQARKKLVRR